MTYFANLFIFSFSNLSPSKPVQTTLFPKASQIPSVHTGHIGTKIPSPVTQKLFEKKTHIPQRVFPTIADCWSQDSTRSKRNKRHRQIYFSGHRNIAVEKNDHSCNGILDGPRGIILIFYHFARDFTAMISQIYCMEVLTRGQ